VRGWKCGADSPDRVSVRLLFIPCIVRWRTVVDEVDKGCSEFCITVGTVTRTDSIHSPGEGLD